MRLTAISLLVVLLILVAISHDQRPYRSDWSRRASREILSRAAVIAADDVLMLIDSRPPGMTFLWPPQPTALLVPLVTKPGDVLIGPPGRSAERFQRPDRVADGVQSLIDH